MEALAGSVTFEEVCALLWSEPVDEVRREIARGREIAFPRLRLSSHDHPR